jgi:tetratricopeptide (TPR) repeat protein
MDVEGALREGEARERAGNLAEAERLFRGVLGATRGTGGVDARAAIVNLARLCANDGREFEALALAHAAASLAEVAGDRWDLARARLQLATALHAIEDYARIPAVLDQIAAALDGFDAPHAARLHLSLALQRARLAAYLGEVETARAALEQAHAASTAVTGHPATDRIVWLVNVVALNVAGRYGEAETWLDRAPASEGVVRRELEFAEQRARCLLGLRPETDGIAAAEALLTGLRAAPDGTVGSVWRLRAAMAIGSRLAELVGPSPVTKAAWDLAGHALLVRVFEIDACLRTMPELSTAGADVFALLNEYRDRFRERHQRLLREVAASRPWPPVDVALVDARNLVVACAWCTRVRVADGHWVPIRQFLPQEGERFTLSHGICALCWEHSAQEIEAHARASRPS